MVIDTLTSKNRYFLTDSRTHLKSKPLLDDLQSRNLTFGTKVDYYTYIQENIKTKNY